MFVRDTPSQPVQTRALALYRRLGYTQVGELPDYFIAGASELLLHKRIG